MEQKKMDRRSLRSRQDIEKALVDLLKTNEWKDISVTKLIQHAGYSRTAFYNNYTDLVDCIDSIIEKQAIDFFDTYEKAGDISIENSGTWDTSPGNPHELVFRAPYELIYENKELYQVLYKRFSNRWLASFIQKVMKHVERSGEYSAHGMEANSINKELYIWSHMWDTLGRVCYWIQHGLVYSPEYMGRQQYLKRIDGVFLAYEKNTERTKNAPSQEGDAR